MTRSRVVVAALALLIAGCASVPRPDPPTVEAVVVALDRVENTNAVFRIGVDLYNPNPQPLGVDALDVLMTIEGERVASASLASPLTLPAAGRGVALLEARASMDGFMRALGAAMLRGAIGSGQAPRYALSGNVTLNGGVQIPFSRSGELSEPARRSSP